MLVTRQVTWHCEACIQKTDRHYNRYYCLYYRYSNNHVTHHHKTCVKSTNFILKYNKYVTKQASFKRNNNFYVKNFLAKMYLQQLLIVLKLFPLPYEWFCRYWSHNDECVLTSRNILKGEVTLYGSSTQKDRFSLFCKMI